MIVKFRPPVFLACLGCSAAATGLAKSVGIRRAINISNRGPKTRDLVVYHAMEIGRAAVIYTLGPHQSYTVAQCYHSSNDVHTKLVTFTAHSISRIPIKL